jgi:hypothetical protein
MSTQTNPFSHAPDSRDFAGRVPDDDASDALHDVECSCGIRHQSARAALECNHETTNHE